MSERTLDVLVIGSGTSAHYCAHGLRGGWKDGDGRGSTRVWRNVRIAGLSAEEIPRRERRGDRDGEPSGRTGIASAPVCDSPALQRLKNEFLDGIPEDTVKGFQEAGIKVLRGHARFMAEDAVQVGDEIVRAANILLATGSTPRRPASPERNMSGPATTSSTCGNCRLEFSLLVEAIFRSNSHTSRRGPARR